MKIATPAWVLLLFSHIFITQSSLAQTLAARHISTNAEIAYKQIQARNHLSIPAQWQTNKPTAEQIAEFQKKISNLAPDVANMQREFTILFPTNGNAAFMREQAVHSWSLAISAGNPQAEQQLNKFVAETLAEKNIPETQRALVLFDASLVSYFKKVGMRHFTEGPRRLPLEFQKSWIEALHATFMEFPTCAPFYERCLAEAKRTKGDYRKQMLMEVLNVAKAPAFARAEAEQLLKNPPPDNGEESIYLRTNFIPAAPRPKPGPAVNKE